MKTIEQIKNDIDALVRKQGNQGALKLGDVLDDIVDIVQDVVKTTDKFKAQITDVATFQAAVPDTATEIVFAFLGDVDLTGYTKSGSIGTGIDVYADGTKYAVVSAKIIFAPENSAEFFQNFSALTTLDLSNFDTTNVTNMHGIFSFCTALTSLDLSNFDTSNATSFESMFYDCSGLTSLDVSNFNTSNATSFENMFYGCSGLTSLDVSNFNTSKATSFAHIFYGCSGLTSLDVSNFDTSNATSFLAMFYDCSGLTSLNLSNFNTSNATSFTNMFYGCNGLTTIIANDWRATVTSQKMFDGCTSLVGGNGTTYNSSHIDATYAHIDVADNPGYFTAPV